MGSINDSRINVKKCASRNGLKLRSANTARSMRCNTAVQDRGRRLNQSQFRSMAEVSFLPSANTRKRASASRELSTIKHLMTGPEGNSEFFFPRMSRETLRFSGNKIHCSPRDQSLSDLLYSKTKRKQTLNNTLRLQQQRSTFRG